MKKLGDIVHISAQIVYRRLKYENVFGIVRMSLRINNVIKTKLNQKILI